MLVYHDFEVLKRGAIDAATRDRKPSDETLVESYFAKLRASDSPVAAVDVPNFHYFSAFALFRVCAIAEGVHRRALDGNASSAAAFEVGKLAPVAAKRGLAAAARPPWRL
jgi:hypothetical protein